MRPSTFWALDSNSDLSQSKSNSNTSTNPPKSRSIRELTRILHCATTWALCRSIFENLQRLVIPLPSIRRYLDSVTRLSSLVDVSFCYSNVSGRLLKIAVLFVQSHTKTFPGLLTKIRCSEGSFQDRMFAYLPAPRNPTELVDANWDNFVNNVAETNLDNVSVINIPHFSLSRFDRLQKQPSFLYRCHALRKYNLVSLGQDSFKWAVDCESDQIPPLESVTIQPYMEPFGDEIWHISRGFGRTLKHFQIDCSSSSGLWMFSDSTLQMNSEPRSLWSSSLVTLRIGHGWRTMPLLETLLVRSTDEAVLDVYPELLQRCPALRILSLEDHVVNHERGAHAAILPPTQVPALTHLKMTGIPALQFNLDTLHSTKALEVLVLRCENIGHYTPTPETGTNSSSLPGVVATVQPAWTWDWFLPCLDTLVLSFEFAMPFQFRMLQGTPSLRLLCLNIVASSWGAKRILTEADFLLQTTSGGRDRHTPADNDGTENIQGECAHITASLLRDPPEPSLQTLTLDELHRVLDYLQSKYNKWSPRPTTRARAPLEEPLSIPEHYVQDVSDWWRTHLDERLNKLDRHFYIHPEDGEEGEAQLYATAQREFVQDIDALLASDPDLQPYLAAIFSNLRDRERKRQDETARQAQFRAAHPDLLVVPSLKRLELYGRWCMSDTVLSTLLGRVFRNVELLEEYSCEGYSTDGFLCATQAMPFVQIVRSWKTYDQMSRPRGYKLVRQGAASVPLVQGSEERVLYLFVREDMSRFLCRKKKDEE